MILQIYKQVFSTDGGRLHERWVHIVSRMNYRPENFQQPLLCEMGNRNL